MVTLFKFSNIFRYLLLVNVVQKNKILSHLRYFREKLANIRQLIQRSVDGPQIGSAAG